MTSFFPAGRTALTTALLGLVLGALPLAAIAQDAPSSEPSAVSSEPSAEQPEPAEPTAPVSPSPETVVATVGGEPITEADLAFAAEDIGQDLNSIPPDQIRAVLLAQLIDLRLMAQAAEAEGLDSDPIYQSRLDYLSDRALRRVYAAQQISAAITEAEVQAEYERQVAAIPAEDEVHARHILVTTEEDARAIKAELEAGADFATLAREKSIEPNAAQSGGDLGYFRAGMMVKPFADAAFAMEVGAVSEPIQTQFGWHIIKVEDRRPAAKPTLEQLAPQIGQQLYIQKYREVFDSLYQAATVDIPDPALKAAIDTQFGPKQ